MSESDDRTQASATTEVILVTGERHRVLGESTNVERAILDAARGSIMQFAWLIEADTGDGIGVNPEYVVALRAQDRPGGG